MSVKRSHKILIHYYNVCKRVWDNLDIRGKKIKLSLLLLGGMVAAILELLGLVVIFPFLRAMIDYHDLLTYHPYVREIVRYFPSDERFGTMIVMSLLLVAIIFAKNIYMILFGKWRDVQMRAWRIVTSTRLMHYYLSSSYEKVLNVGQSQIVNNINVNTIITLNFVRDGIDFFVYMITLTVFALWFAKSHFYIMLFIVVWFFGIIFVMYKMLTRKIRALGDERVRVNKEQTGYVLHVFNAFKEVRIFKCEDYFKGLFHKINVKGAFVDTTEMTYLRLPIYVMECALLIGLLIVIVALLYHNLDNTSYVVGFMAVLAMLFIRMGPMFARIQTLLHSMDAAHATVERWLQEMEQVKEWESQEKAVNASRAVQDKDITIPFLRVFGYRHMCFSYASNEQKPILKDINVSFERGKKYGIVGRSGVGKTTFVDIVLGLLSVTEGEFFVDDRIMSAEDIRYWQKHLSFVPQKSDVLSTTLRENIAFGVPRENIDDARILEILKLVHLEDMVEHLAHGIYTHVGEGGIQFSGGQKQRIAIARALYYGKDVIVLDEATSALDVITENDVMSCIDHLKGKTMLIVAHRLSTLKSCDEILYFDHGTIKGKGSFEALSQEFDDFAEMVAKSSF